MATLGEQLAEIRRERGLTQDDVANLAAFPRRYYQRIERDKFTPHKYNLQRVADVLGVDIAFVVTKREAKDNV